MIAGLVFIWLAGGGLADAEPSTSSPDKEAEPALPDKGAEPGDVVSLESAPPDQGAELEGVTVSGGTATAEPGAATPMAPAPAPAPDATPSPSPPPGGDIVDPPAAGATDSEPPSGPAVLPSEGPGEPQLGGAGARGGASITPLPPPPPPEDPATITAGPWRGHWWFSLGLGATIPVAGARPAAGEVTAIVPELTLGYRPKPYVAIHLSMSTASHDTEQQTVTLGDGTQVDEVDIGRLSAFDLATVRGYLPLKRRWQPWLEAGAGVGVYSAPFSERRQAVGLVRTGLGADFWLAAKLTLSLHGAYRLAIIGNALGHSVRTMATFGLHW